jgi:hypothetical protein
LVDPTVSVHTAVKQEKLNGIIQYQFANVKYFYVLSLRILTMVMLMWVETNLDPKLSTDVIVVSSWLDQKKGSVEEMESGQEIIQLANQYSVQGFETLRMEMWMMETTGQEQKLFTPAIKDTS